MFRMLKDDGFSWAKAIAVNQKALIAIVAAIFQMMRIEPDDEPDRLPRLFHRRVLRWLVPAESAARRLIVMAATGMAVKPAKVRAARPAPQGLKARTRAASEAAGPAQARPPSFRLYDSRKYFPELVQRRRRRKMPDHRLPRVWVAGDEPPFRPPPPPKPEDDGMVNAQPICRRLHALKAALADLPRQAKRLVRWQARREQQQKSRNTFAHPMRPGLPPGWRDKPTHEVDHILSKCHAHACYAMDYDTS
jgi:hypothetical protein